MIYDLNGSPSPTPWGPLQAIRGLRPWMLHKLQGINCTVELLIWCLSLPLYHDVTSWEDGFPSNLIFIHIHFTWHLTRWTFSGFDNPNSPIPELKTFSASCWPVQKKCQQPALEASPRTGRLLTLWFCRLHATDLQTFQIKNPMVCSFNT